MYTDNMKEWLNHVHFYYNDMKYSVLPKAMHLQLNCC